MAVALSKWEERDAKSSAVQDTHATARHVDLGHGNIGNVARRTSEEAATGHIYRHNHYSFTHSFTYTHSSTLHLVFHGG
jgi:hypothetical protein